MSFRKQFESFIQQNDFKSAESLLAEDIFSVEDMMDDLSEEEASFLESHWSAIQTGEQIVTPIEVLTRISCYLKFKPDSKLVDLGSGHGHPAFIFGLLNPSLEIIGYEIVKEKVIGASNTAKKLELKNVEFIEQDLSNESFKLQPADYYYLYNPANEEILARLVKKIIEISKTSANEICVISAGGKDLDYLRDSSEFSEDTSLELIGISIFSSKSN